MTKEDEPDTAWDRDVRTFTCELLKSKTVSSNVCAAYAIESADDIERARRIRRTQTGEHFGVCRHQMGPQNWNVCRLLAGHEGPHGS